MWELWKDILWDILKWISLVKEDFHIKLQIKKMRDFKLTCAVFALVAALSLQLCQCDIVESTTTINSDNVTISKRGPPLLSTGNELWDGLIRDCLKKPTFSCIQKNVYTFLDSSLGLKNVNLTNRVQLTQNRVDYQLPEQPNDEENEIFFEGRGMYKVANREHVLITYCLFKLLKAFLHIPLNNLSLYMPA